MKKILITQSNYIPWKGYFDAINLVDEFVIYDDMQYTKRDWRNRNKIKTAQGLLWLSIPVEVKGKYFQRISETKVSNSKWTVDHWTSVKINYSKAPFFRNYREFFEELYLNCKESYLSEINFRFLNAIMQLMEIKTTVRWSSEFVLRGDKSEKLLGVCEDAGATEYFSGPAAKDYLETQIFSDKGIGVNWLDYSGYKEYNQLYPPFEHSVSVLDLLFNTGPNFKTHMKSFHDK